MRRFGFPRLLLSGLTVLLLVAGCARHPWRQPLAGTDKIAPLELYRALWQRQAACGTCLDTDARIFFHNHLIDRAAGGYLKLMQPGYVKFIADNPLGQPVLAFASDGSRFDYLNVQERLFMEGDVARFGIAHDLPTALFSSSAWGRWLTGRLPAPERITEVRADRDNRGIWFGIAFAEEKEGEDRGREYLLLDPDGRLLRTRILSTSENGSASELEIEYSDWSSNGAGKSCQHPSTIMVSGLPYGGTIKLHFRDTKTLAQCTAADFILARPGGYRYQRLQSPLQPADDK